MEPEETIESEPHDVEVTNTRRAFAELERSYLELETGGEG